MKLLVIFLSHIYLTAYASEVPSCDLKAILKTLKTDIRKKYSNDLYNEEADNLANSIKSTSLEASSYMAKWKLHKPNQAGPWALEGNTLVISSGKENFPDWYNTVGKHSFGIGFLHTPEQLASLEGSPSAILRVGDTIYPFRVIQNTDTRTVKLAEKVPEKKRKWWQIFRRKSEDEDQMIEVPIPPHQSYTEVTFTATPEELKEINDFILARTKKEVKSSSDIKPFTSPSTGREEVINKGDVINPQYKHTGSTLYRESCTGACTSMFNPRWLEHYSTPSSLLLARIAINKGIKPDINSKAPIFSGFRNPNASSIFIYDSMKPAKNNFIEEHDWGKVRGMMWGFIPDPRPSKPSKSYDSKRFSLQDWGNK